MIRSRLAAAAAGLLVSGTVMFAAAPAFATTPLTGCTPAAAAPLYTSTCLPVVSPTAPGAVTVTLPGVGTLTFTVKPDGTIDTTGTPPVATATGANFSAGTPQVSQDGTHVSVTFVNAANPVQKYVVRAKVSQTNPTTVGGAPGLIVTAKAGVAGQGEHKKGHSDQEGDNDHDDGANQGQGPALTALTSHGSWSGGAGGHQHSQGGDGNSQGGGGD